MDTLTFPEKMDLVRLMVELRQAPPLGIVGLLEIRNLLANLFPEFSAVRDDELDELIHEYATSLGQQWTETIEPDLDETP
jgi:hypothetical protein